MVPFWQRARILRLDAPCRHRVRLLDRRPTHAVSVTHRARITGAGCIGKVSYGLYLFHWPVFVLLRQRGWELTSISGLLVALALTTAITLLSYFLLERPIRTANVDPRLTLFGASAALASLLALFLIVPSGRGFLEPDSSVLAAASADNADLDAELEFDRS